MSIEVILKEKEHKPSFLWNFFERCDLRDSVHWTHLGILPMGARMANDDPEDDPSTLVRSGKLAMTFTEMQEFVRDIETRPPDRLSSDLEGLLALPDAKHQLVVMVLRKKTRPDVAEGPALLEQLQRLQRDAADPAVRERARLFLEKSTS
jgi:hypothetical protein